MAVRKKKESELNQLQDTELPKTSSKKEEHQNLCEIAAKWLQRGTNYQRAHLSGPACTSSFVELKTYARHGETVDSIGFRRDYSETTSILVEAKTSISDFKADAKKPFRVDPDTGVGNYRYYICPEGLITVDMLPLKWGLIWVNSRGHCSVQAGHVLEDVKPIGEGDYRPWKFVSNKDAENALLCSIVVKIESVKDVVDVRKEADLYRQKYATEHDKNNALGRDLSMEKWKRQEAEYLLSKLVSPEEMERVSALPITDDFWSERYVI